MLYYGKGGVVMLKVKQSEKEIQLKAGNYFLAKTEEKKGRNALFQETICPLGTAPVDGKTFLRYNDVIGQKGNSKQQICKG